MNSEYFKSEGRKGYNKNDVDSFILRLNESHSSEITQKNDIIKQLTTEAGDYKEKYEKAAEELEKLKKDMESSFDTKNKETSEFNERMGEKFSAAEDAAKELISKAEAECARLKETTLKNVEEYADKTREKIDKYSESAHKIIDIYIEKQHLVASGIEQARRHLDEASKNILKIISENELQ